MKQSYTRFPILVRLGLMLLICIGGLATPLMQAQVIVPTQTDVIIIDNGTAGQAEPGDRIRYNVTIQNTGGASGNNTQLNVVPDPRTTFVPGSFKSSPLAVPDAYACTGNVGINISAALGVKANDFDDDLTAATVTAGTFTTTQGGSIMLSADGSFMYSPPPGFTGTDTYTYTLNDATPLAAPCPTTDASVITFTVSNLIWFIDNSSVAATSDGRLTSPFKTLADFNAGSAAAGSVIYIENTGTNYTGGIVLQDGERLFGEGHTGAANLSGVLPFALAANSKTLPNINGTRPVITNAAGDGVLMAMNNTLRGFDVGACSGFAMNNTAMNSVGTLTISEVSINNTTGGGFDASNGGALTVTFPSVSTNGGTYGIDLNNCTGTFTVSGGTITNPTTAGVYIKDGTVTFSSSGAISTNAGFAVDIDNHDSNNITFSGNITSTGMGIQVQNCGGGTITFSGASKSLSTGANTAVNLVTNGGATLTFSGGGLVISTTTGKGFSATGSGTVNVTGTGNNITKSGNGLAFEMNMVNAGLSAITFDFVDVTGGTGTAISIINSSSPKNLGDVDVARSGGGTAILADGAGTLNITDGTINSGNQVAIDINNTVLGIVLTSVSANGAGYGIDVTSTTGSFTINGTSTTNGSGGTIQNIANRGVNFVSASNITLKNITFTNANTVDAGGAGTCDALTNTACNGALYFSTVTTIVLNNVDVNGTAEQGLNANNISNLTVEGCSFTNCGNNEQFEGCMKIRELTGTCLFNNSTFTFASDETVEIINAVTNGALNLTVTNCTFSDNFDKTFGEKGLHVTTSNTTTNSLTVDNCFFRRLKSQGVRASATAGTFNVNVTDTEFNKDTKKFMSGVEIIPAGTSTMDINVNRNTMTLAGGSAILVQGNNSSVFQARINLNMITGPNSCSDCIMGGDPETPGCNCFGDGIVVWATNSASGKAEVSNNTIAGIDVNGRGIYANARDAANLNINLLSNNVTVAGDSWYCIDITSGSSGVGETATVCANVASNTVSISGTGPQTFFAHFRARSTASGTTVNLQGPGTTLATMWDMKGNMPPTTAMSPPSLNSGAAAGGAVNFNQAACTTITHPTAMVNPVLPGNSIFRNIHSEHVYDWAYLSQKGATSGSK